MKTFNKTDLPEIKWVEPGESVGMMQGIAINHLLKIYRGAKQAGYGWLKDEEGENRFCYFLDGLKTKFQEGTISCLVAFEEKGDSVEGYAIYK